MLVMLTNVETLNVFSARHISCMKINFTDADRHIKIIILKFIVFLTLKR